MAASDFSMCRRATTFCGRRTPRTANPRCSWSEEITCRCACTNTARPKWQCTLARRRQMRRSPCPTGRRSQRNDQKIRPRAIGAFVPSEQQTSILRRDRAGGCAGSPVNCADPALAGVRRSGDGNLRRVGDGGLDARRRDVHLRLQLCFLLCLLLLLDSDGGREVHGALDDCVLMDDEARGDDVAGDLRGVAQLDALRGVDLAIDAAADDNFARGDVRLRVTFFAHGKTALVQLDLTGDTTLDDQVLRRGDIAGDNDVLSDEAAFGSGHGIAPVSELSRDGALSVLTTLTLVRSSLFAESKIYTEW